VERNTNPNIERMLNVFNLHLSTPEEKAVSRFCASKPREICKRLAGAYNSNSHARGLHYLTFVHKKQAEKPMQWGESSILFEGGETLAI
jgi:hypothetical protein